MAVIELKHVSKSFLRKGEIGASKAGKAQRQVLCDVDLEVCEGEIVCLLGKNGSGKTTLTRIVSTLIEPDQGSASVCGFDVVTKGREVRRLIGVMLNAGEGGFQPRLSASHNLQYYAVLYQIPMPLAKARVERLMDRFGLGDRGSDQYQSFSSGMRRRLALVRALLPDPKVLLLDEPTLGVDPWTTKDVHKQLGELRDLGKTVLCTTNNMAEAQVLGDRTCLLEGGRLVERETVRTELA